MRHIVKAGVSAYDAGTRYALFFETERADEEGCTGFAYRISEEAAKELADSLATLGFHAEAKHGAD